MASATIAAPVLSDETKAHLESLIKINLHLANLLSFLENKVEDEAETLVHAARRYLNDEFQILLLLTGDDK